MKGCATRIALKRKHKTTRKWPIESFLYVARLQGIMGAVCIICIRLFSVLQVNPKEVFQVRSSEKNRNI